MNSLFKAFLMALGLFIGLSSPKAMAWPSAEPPKEVCGPEAVDLQILFEEQKDGVWVPAREWRHCMWNDAHASPGYALGDDGRRAQIAIVTTFAQPNPAELALDLYRVDTYSGQPYGDVAGANLILRKGETVSAVLVGGPQEDPRPLRFTAYY